MLIVVLVLMVSLAAVVVTLLHWEVRRYRHNKRAHQLGLADVKLVRQERVERYRG